MASVFHGVPTCIVGSVHVHFQMYVYMKLRFWCEFISSQCNATVCSTMPLHTPCTPIVSKDWKIKSISCILCMV